MVPRVLQNLVEHFTKKEKEAAGFRSPCAFTAVLHRGERTLALKRDVEPNPTFRNQLCQFAVAQSDDESGSGLVLIHPDPMVPHTVSLDDQTGFAVFRVSPVLYPFDRDRK